MNDFNSVEQNARRPRLLVLRGGAIGDFVMTLPALEALRERWPACYIDLIGYPRIAELALVGGFVDKVRSLDSAEIAGLFSLNPRISDAQKASLASFDAIISYLHDPDGIVRKNMLAAGARRVVCGSPMVKDRHAVDHFLKPLEELAVYPEKPMRPRLILPDDYMAKGRARIAKIGASALAMHPGSGSAAKNWPLDKFTALGKRFNEKGLSPFFVLGEADAGIARELNAMGCPIPVVSDCSLMDLACVLSVCEGYIGNDSGVTHIAACLGVPVVALFGPSDSRLWGPMGANVTIIESAERATESLAAISVDHVYAIAQKHFKMMSSSRRLGT